MKVIFFAAFFAEIHLLIEIFVRSAGFVFRHVQAVLIEHVSILFKKLVFGVFHRHEVPVHILERFF